MLLQKNSLHFRSVSPPCREGPRASGGRASGRRCPGVGVVSGAPGVRAAPHSSSRTALWSSSSSRSGSSASSRSSRSWGGGGRARGNPLGQDQGKPGPSTRALQPGWPRGLKRTTLVSTRGRQGASRQQDRRGGLPRAPAFRVCGARDSPMPASRCAPLAGLLPLLPPLHLADPLLCPSRPRLKLLSGRTPQPPGRGRARVPAGRGPYGTSLRCLQQIPALQDPLTAAAGRSALQGERLCPAWGHTHAPPVAPTDPHSRHHPQPRPGHHSPRTS